MTTDARLLLDEIFSEYDVSARYSIRIQAEPERIYSAIQEGLPVGAVTKILMALRRFPTILSGAGEPNQPENSFYKLKQLANREAVIGIIGQFWKPVAHPVPIHSLEEFMEFRKDGFSKAALNLLIIKDGSKGCIVSTETRVLSFGEAKTHFKEYWRVVAPFSGMIRREMLRKLKRKAESRPVRYHQ